VTDRSTPSHGAADSVTDACRADVTDACRADVPQMEGFSRREAIDGACLDRAEQMTDPGYDYGRRFARSDWYALAAATAFFAGLMYVGFFL
jgi:hypothetical protein